MKLRRTSSRRSKGGPSLLKTAGWAGSAALGGWALRQLRLWRAAKPKSVLKERLAKGHIDRDEYKRLKREL